MDRVLDSSRLAQGACVICSLGNAQASPTKCQHLGHERQAVEFTVAVEARYNFRRTSDFDQVSRLQGDRCTLEPTYPI
jgi:hypothetical protein